MEDKNKVKETEPDDMKISPVTLIAILLILGITATNVVVAYVAKGKYIPIGYGNVVAIVFFYGIGIFVKNYFWKVYKDVRGEKK